MRNQNSSSTLMLRRRIFRTRLFHCRCVVIPETPTAVINSEKSEQEIGKWLVWDFLNSHFRKNCSNFLNWNLRLKNRPLGARFHFWFNRSLIIESYLEYQYAPVYSIFTAQLFTVPVHTAFKSRTKTNITTKRKLSFAFAFECRRSSRRTDS